MKWRERKNIHTSRETAKRGHQTKKMDEMDGQTLFSSFIQLVKVSAELVLLSEDSSMKDGRNL